MAKIILLSADKCSGKTTALIRLLDKLTTLSVQARGIVSPPVEEDGIKVAINLLDVSDGDEKRLAVPKTDESIEPSGLHWRFDANTLDWGNQVLANAVPCDILFVDEMGPLEFNRGEGLMNGFTAIDSHRYLVALVTIRPSLLDAATRRWPDAEVYEVNRKDQTRLVGDLFRQIAK